MLRIIFFSILISFFMSCGDTSTTTTKTDVSTQAPAAAPVQMKPAYPSIPIEKVEHLYKNCDYIDYVFYTTNFSISQKEKSSIQGAIAYIAAEVPQGLHPNCKAIGRVFFQIDGENAAEADFYFQEGCHYFVFLEKNKPKYCNMMTDQGVAYFDNIFKQVNSSQPK